jgi:hypothetical protein
VQIDNAAAIDAGIELSAASNIAAVTVAELVTAWAAIAVATGTTGSTDVDTGRFKVVKTTLGSARYLQVYGEFARVAGFGYGYGAVIIPFDTQQSIAFEPVQTDSERLEILDTAAVGSALVTDSKRRGQTYTFTDTASDQFLKAVITGAEWDFEDEILGEPLPTAIKPSFTLEFYTARYLSGDNHETDIADYIQRRSQACKVTASAAVAGDRNGQAKPYTITATAYRDPVTHAVSPDTTEATLTVEEYAALDIFDV